MKNDTLDVQFLENIPKRLIFVLPYESKFTMSTFGYLVISPAITSLTSDRETMRSLGCSRIFEERAEDITERPLWHQLLEEVTAGSTIVLPELSTAIESSKHLLTFLEWIRFTKVRVIAYNEQLENKRLQKSGISISGSQRSQRDL
ncbi:MAG: recombinase family protein [Bacteroidales bacterium]|nr:recombinase family protein [Bacteroidales bacterium]